MSRQKRETHNTHMLLPRDLYLRAKERAWMEACSVTQIVVEALTEFLNRKEDPK